MLGYLAEMNGALGGVLRSIAATEKTPIEEADPKATRIFALVGTRHPLSALPARLASDRHAHRDQCKKRAMPGRLPAVSPREYGHKRARRRDWEGGGGSWVWVLAGCPTCSRRVLLLHCR